MGAQVREARAPTNVAQGPGVLTEREQFVLPAANLGILSLSLLVHWFVAGSWTFWVAVHFICLGLAAVASVHLWATPNSH